MGAAMCYSLGLQGRGCVGVGAMCYSLGLQGMCGGCYVLQPRAYRGCVGEGAMCYSLLGRTEDACVRACCMVPAMCYCLGLLGMCGACHYATAYQGARRMDGACHVLQPTRAHGGWMVPAMCYSLLGRTEDGWCLPCATAH